MNRFLKFWLGLTLVLHLLGAVFSSGFYHADEHFQILEFANARLGQSPTADLPVEYQEKMRPWLQPAIFVGVIQGARAVGIENPATWALLCRLLSSLLGFSALVALALGCRKWFPDPFWQRAAIIALCLAWYMPAFHARHSSENWGGATFIIAFCLWVLRREISLVQALGIGFLFGCSFEFRYQIGVMIAGTFLWLLFIRREKWNRLAAGTVGVLLAIGLGTAVDAWGYEQWVFAPWNYIDFNLVRGMVGSVDTDPWWDLFRRAFTETWPLLGFLLLVSLPVAWVLFPLHPLTWSHLPLFLTHAIIGHKELRFLFPLAHAAPVFLILALSREPIATFVRKRPIVWLCKILIGWNLVALAILTLMPAWMPIRFQEKMIGFKAAHSGPIEIYWKERSPYSVLGHAIHFYRPQGIVLHEYTHPEEVIARIPTDGTPLWLFHDGFRLSDDLAALRPYCKPEFQSLPGSLDTPLRRVGLERLLFHVTNWSLFRCVRYATQ